MVNDSIDILDAKIVNLGVNFEILSRRGFNKTSILSDCLDALSDLFASAPDIGEFLEITKIYKRLNLIEGVADTVNLDIVQKIGSSYADTFFDIESNLSADRRYIQFPIDTVYEFKFNTDFRGTIR